MPIGFEMDHGLVEIGRTLNNSRNIDLGSFRKDSELTIGAIAPHLGKRPQSIGF